ncbi:HAD-IIIA family hydrolase [Paenibacillus sp. N1-5-1-14]|uniref:HAD-IIIA family hydrolase n=1 Tax=Paenibacillus radicibacter TaxID=2972488 RepID=UPI002158F0AA|nr:HAD-IIIA family hydrolase [Paenibacillus radicibacter]MCR8644387.1 HAD-IIIA family hydrolase [Paenibacillus radicibacter]
MNIQAVFIDRDGTIGGSDEVEYPDSFELFANVDQALGQLKVMGIKLLGFTNQPGIASGEATEEAFYNEMKAFGFDDVYICPHQHDDGCSCRKPNTGMLERAAIEHELDLTQCIVIGDRWSDMLAAHRAGCTKILVQTGAGHAALHTYRHKWSEIEPDYIVKDFAEAAQTITYIRNIGGD